MSRRIKFSLVITLVELCTGCESKPAEVHFLIPNGYRGVFKVVVDQPDGTIIPKKDGRFIVEIPKNGLLKIKGENPFHSPRYTAAFMDGKTIPYGKEFLGNPPKGIALWDLGVQVRYKDDQPINTICWFIGTNEEFQKVDYSPPEFKM